jgi:hypothetical protein
MPASGALTPSFVNGTFTTMCSSMPAGRAALRIMPSASVATTSALVGPFHRLANLLQDRAIVAPSFARSGLVVMPSMMPSGTRLSMSFRLPVSINNFAV